MKKPPTKKERELVAVNNELKKEISRLIKKDAKSQVQILTLKRQNTESRKFAPPSIEDLVGKEMVEAVCGTQDDKR